MSKESVADVDLRSYSRLSFIFKYVTPETSSIIPRLRIVMEVRHTPLEYSATMPPHAVLSFARSELEIMKVEDVAIRETYMYVSTLVADPPLCSLPPNSSATFSLFADLDYYRLAQIEKLRKGGDIQTRLLLTFIVKIEVQGQPSVEEVKSVYIFVRIPKSDWVEEILPQFKFKDVALLEVPRIDHPRFGEVVKEINEAWRLYSMGEYDGVLVNCRKAIEALRNIIVNMGFEKEEVDEKGGKRSVPDWRKALGHEEVGKFIEDVVKKFYSFLSPAAHHGKSINREDAELAIMFSHAIVNYVSRKLMRT